MKQHFKIAILWVIVLTLSGVAMAAGDLGEKQLIDSYNATGIKLYQKLAKSPGNKVVSPYSIGSVMTLALLGASGETEAEMRSVLGMTLPIKQLTEAQVRLKYTLGRLNADADTVLTIANALCLTASPIMVNQQYRQRIAAGFQAEIFTGTTVAPVNAWVKEKTRGNIDSIINTLSENSVCVLLNAIYYKGPWASAFDKNKTQPGAFYTRPGKSVSVPMMHKTEKYPFIRQTDFMAAKIPCQADSLAMVIVLPEQKDGLSAIEDTLSADRVQMLLTRFEQSRPVQLKLRLPRFKIDFSTGLVNAFQAQGMNLAFSPPKANFGGIAIPSDASGRIWISQIQHAACFEVNEEGSQAAAATAVEFATRSTPQVPVFNAEHPFLFFLVDTKTNAVLFIGRVVNPLTNPEKK